MSALKKSVSIVIPAYNEEQIFKGSLKILENYLQELEKKFRFEIIIVNDGSTDRTGQIADEFARDKSNIKVIHHITNLQLGTSLQTGFKHSTGDYVVTVDLDWSYSPEHIGKLLETITATHADVVIASPYMKDGQVKNVPFIRKLVSKVINRYMKFFAQQKFNTFTGMVRAYRGEYIRSLNLRSVDYEINPEILYKSFMLRARIVEIPATLDWSYRNEKLEKKHISPWRILRGIFPGLMSGFIFRPYVFYLSIGGVLFLTALYILIWILINTFQLYPDLNITSQFFDDRFSMAVGMLFQKRPHAFLIGGFVLVVAIQFLSMGFLALQNKRYYEELYHLNYSKQDQ